jgi:hypothetical protein
VPDWVKSAVDERLTLTPVYCPTRFTSIFNNFFQNDDVICRNFALIRDKQEQKGDDLISWCGEEPPRWI